MRAPSNGTGKFMGILWRTGRDSTENIALVQTQSWMSRSLSTVNRELLCSSIAGAIGGAPLCFQLYCNGCGLLDKMNILPA